MRSIHCSDRTPGARNLLHSRYHRINGLSVSSAAKGVRGFTVVELLAILCVLSLLALSLLPAVAHSKGPSQRAQCLDNLRQLMQAAGMFALENRDSLPYPNWGNLMPGWLYRPVSGSPPNLSSPPYSSDPILAYQTGLLWPLVKNRNVYLCPLDAASKYYTQRANKLSTYVMNGAVCGYGKLAGQGYYLNQFEGEAFCLWEPDETIGSPPIGAFVYNDASAYPDRNEGPGRNHPGGTPIGTFGGGAVFRSVSFFRQQQTGRGPNLVWCVPGSIDGH